MTKKDLMRQLKHEGQSIELDKDRILSQIPRQENIKRSLSWHPKLIMTLVILLMVVVGITLFRENPTAPSIITVDINPSIELTVDQDDTIIDYRALNLDGEVVLETLNLSTINMTEAIELIINQATALGYMDMSSTVQVTAFNSKTSQENALNERLKNHLKNRIVLSEITTEIKDEAKSLGISPRKLILIQSIIQMNPDYELDDLIELTIPVLNEMKRSYVAAEIQELKETLETYKAELELQKATLVTEIETYIQTLNSEIEALKLLYSDNLITFNQDYITFSNTYFPNAQIPLLPTKKYQKLLLLESKLEAYEVYLKNQVEMVFDVHMRGLYTHLVDTHANLNSLRNWVPPTQNFTTLTTIELYLEASLYDQLFLSVAKRLDLLLNQPVQGSGQAYLGLLEMTYEEFMIYYESDQVSETLKTSNYIQNILNLYQEKES